MLTQTRTRIPGTSSNLADAACGFGNAATVLGKPSVVLVKLLLHLQLQRWFSPNRIRGGEIACSFGKAALFWGKPVAFM
ncbi:hypothetical protein [Geomonas limicola]|uniref:hypothetical protein n=1 Tax=Geomonas limicola TaxID=2740186 RepID=UPI001614D2F9|nr:hypothetical protein [Geomonas limicola]